jgi:hypothetical protein
LPTELSLPDGFASAGECLVELTAGTRGTQKQQTAHQLLGEGVFEALETSYFVRHSRAAQVAEEFSQSIGRTATNARDLQSLATEAVERMQAFRAAVRPYSWDIPDAVEWSLSKASFEKANASRSNWEELRQGYDSMWRHFSMLHILQVGEKEGGSQTKGYAPKVDELEACAGQWRQHPALRSQTLERELVDALVYAETLAFAQMMAARLGRLQKGLPFAVGPAPGPNVGKELWKSLGRMAVEVALMGATWVLAYSIAQEDAIATWSLFLAATALRWILRKLDALKPTASVQQPEALLTDMARVYELLAHATFHRGVVRQELQRVTALGAVYSPFVFELLELD